MTSKEQIVDILVLQKQGYTPTEIARQVQRDPRTVRRYLADPTLITKPVTREKRGVCWTRTAPALLNPTDMNDQSHVI